MTNNIDFTDFLVKIDLRNAMNEAFKELHKTTTIIPFCERYGIHITNGNMVCVCCDKELKK